jgi:hypothetical protein
VIIAFRTDEQLDEKLRRVAREQKKTRTEVIREALDLYLSDRSRIRQPRRARKSASFAEIVKSDIASWDGPEDASVNTGKQLRQIFDEKNRARRL